MRLNIYFLFIFIAFSCHSTKVLDSKTLERLKRIEELQNEPFPKKPSFYALNTFMNDYNSVYKSYGSLLKTLDLYEKNLNFDNDEVKKGLDFRLNENWQETHWVFFSGVADLMNFLVLRSKNKLQSTKEEYFIKRMKILVYIGEKLDNYSQTQKYTEFLKLLYMNVSENIFGRPLAPSKTQK